MIVGLDIDGVIRNFVDAVRAKYKEVYPEHDVPVVSEWNISKIYPIGEGIYDFCFNEHVKEVFYDAKPYDGAMKFVSRLCARHEPVIITSQGNVACKMWTMKWLEDHGVLDIVSHVVMCGRGEFDKHMVKVDVLIDDKVETLEKAESFGIYGIGPRRAWNDGRWDNLFDSFDEMANEIDRFSFVLEKAKYRKAYK